MLDWPSRCLSLTAICTLLCVKLAFGQSTTKASDDQSSIEVIEVTSQQRVQSIYDIASTVNSVSGEQLEQLGINDVSTIQFTIPGLSNGDFNLGQPQYFIRGIGTNADSASAESSISYYFNNIYHGRTASMNVPLFDIARVEVLKGPQGTYQGKNALAGSIKLFSNSAEFDTFHTLSVKDSERSGSEFTSVSNVELSPTSALRLSSLYRSTDGYMKNPRTHTEFNDSETFALRASTRMLSTDWQHDVIANWSKQSSTNAGQRTIGGSFGENLQQTSPHIAKHFYYTNEEKQADTTRDLYNLSYHGNNEQKYYQQQINVGAHCHDFINYDAPGPAIIELDPFNIFNNIDESGCQFGINYHRLYREENPWSLGFYLDYEDTRRIESFLFNRVSDTLNGTAKEDSKTYHASIFMTKEWQWQNNWRLNVGARFNHDKKKSNIDILSVDNITYHETYQVDVALDHNVFTPHAHLSYQIEKHQLVYFNLDTGYKAGGFQPAATKALAKLPYKKEQAFNAELGYKWLSDDTRKSLLASAFYGEFDDLQVLVQKPDPTRPLTGVITENAAKAKSTGVEINYQQAFEWVLLNANIAYLDGRYTKYQGRPDINNNYLRNAPRWSGSIASTFYLPEFYHIQSALIFMYSYQNRRFQDIENLPLSSIEQVHLVNAGWIGNFQQWQIELAVTNLFNHHHYQHNFAIPTGVGALGTFPAPAPPQTFSLKVSYTFD